MISRCIAGLSAIAVFSFLWCLPLHAYHGVAGGPIIVNGQELSAQQGQGLMQLYGPIPAGSYWYDTVFGLWGPAGGPSTGQIEPLFRYTCVSAEVSAGLRSGWTGGAAERPQRGHCVNATDDNCPHVTNARQKDYDGDGQGC